MSDRSWSADGEGVEDTLTMEQWEALPDDPDPLHDLGYEAMDLEVFETEDGTGRVLVLPTDEEMLANDAFIVAEPDGVYDLEGQR